MPRVREIEEPGDDPILGEAWKRELETFGFILNTTKVQAHCPPSCWPSSTSASR